MKEVATTKRRKKLYTKQMKMDIGRRLQLERQKKGKTQQQYADLLEVSLNEYQKYENGSRGLSMETIVYIAMKTNISIDYLITGKNIWFENLTDEELGVMANKALELFGMGAYFMTMVDKNDKSKEKDIIKEHIKYLIGEMFEDEES